MRNTLVLLLFALCSYSCFGQNRNNIYADVALPLFAYGFSGTWDRGIIKNLNLGAGAQVYAYDVTNSNVHTAIYADIKPCLNRKHSLFFVLCDLGVDLYSAPATYYYKSHNNAFYSAFGLGYGYKINKRGMAPYVSLKLAGDTYTEYAMPHLHRYNNDDNKSSFYDGNVILSVGFKF